MPKPNYIAYLQTITLIITISFSSNSYIYAQSFCPPNIDFELGGVFNWNTFTGSCCPIVANTPGVVNGRHTITSGTGLDPYGNFPVVAPAAGIYSFRLGNSSTGRQTERARYYVRVPSGPGKHILLYRYAVVFQDPGHTANLQPSFQVRAYDSATNAPLPCLQFNYVASSSIPGFRESTAQARVYYLPWTTGTLNLSNYAGQTIALDFISSDCGLGGHFGYGYIDLNCGIFKIEAVVCDSSTNVTFNGPPGYQFYEWRDSALTTVLGNSQSLSIPIPSTQKTFAVILTPYPGFGCKDTLYTKYTTHKYSNIQATATGDTTICPGAKSKMNVGAYSLDSPITYKWLPATNLSCNVCADPTVTATSTTTYQAIATNFLGCADTQDVTITVDTVVRADISLANNIVCSSDSIYLINSAPNPSTANKMWTISGNYSVIGGSLNSDTVIIKWNSIGSTRVIFEAEDGGCFAHDTAYVSIGSHFAISLPQLDTICIGSSTVLKLTHNSSSTLTFNWTPNNSLSCNNCQQPTANPTSNTIYTVTASNGQGCNDTAQIAITIDSNVHAVFEMENDSVCINDPIWIKNKGGNSPLTDFLWSLDSAGNIIHGIGQDSIIASWSTHGTKKVVHTAFEGPCNTRDSQIVYVIPTPIAGFDIDANICVGQVAKMTVVNNDNTYYSWHIDEQQITDTAFKHQYSFSWNNLGPKKIKLSVSRNFCYDTLEKIITVREIPIAKISYDNEEDLCAGQRFTLSAQQGQRYQYSWSPARLFSENVQQTVSGTVERTEYVYLSVRNQWECESLDSLLLTGKNCCKIFIPDAFTPNNDGFNDYLYPIGIYKHQLIQFIIAHRNGNIMLDTKSPDIKWDGNYKGKRMGIGTYAYYIKYVCNNGETIEKKGTFHLIR